MVAKLLLAHGVDPKRVETIAKLAGGSVAIGSRLADPDLTERHEAFVSRAMLALDAKDLSVALEVAEEAKKHKDALPTHLAALAARLADDARAGASAQDRRAEIAATRYAMALAAARQLDGNASAQLVVESMLAHMRGT